MIKFDINKLEIRHVYVRSVTQALGGSITIVDQQTDVATRLPVPYAVARRFIKEHKTQHYIVPVLSAIMVYGDIVVAVERHHLGNLGVERQEGLFGEKVWCPVMERTLDKVRAELEQDGWLVDGSYIYRVQPETMLNYKSLSADGKFLSVGVDAYRFSDFQLMSSVVNDSSKKLERHCLKFVAGDGTQVISPPIWSNIKTVVGKQEAIKQEQDDDVNTEDANDNNDNNAVVIQGENPFDSINEKLLVNVNFALKAARDLSDHFGYQVVESLRLEDLMIKMKTVNLPTLETHVKKTCEIGMSYTHSVAWLMGFVYKAETLEQLISVRALLKYMSRTGSYQRRKLKHSAIFKEQFGVNNIPLINHNLFTSPEAKKRLSAAA
jgi:hypothetical protein